MDATMSPDEYASWLCGIPFGRGNSCVARAL